MSEPTCEVCGKPGFVQCAPGAPYSGCWCPEHTPRPDPAWYWIAKAVLILAILGVSIYKLIRWASR